MPEMLVSLVLYYSITSGIWFYGKTRTGMFSKTVIFALVFDYLVFLITFLSEKKTEENLKIQLVTYSTEMTHMPSIFF
jgi:hypothetical protein